MSWSQSRTVRDSNSLMYSVSAGAQTHAGMSGCQTVARPARAEGTWGQRGRGVRGQPGAPCTARQRGFLGQESPQASVSVCCED